MMRKIVLLLSGSVCSGNGRRVNIKHERMHYSYKSSLEADATAGSPFVPESKRLWLNKQGGEQAPRRRLGMLLLAVKEAAGWGVVGHGPASARRTRHLGAASVASVAMLESLAERQDTEISSTKSRGARCEVLSPFYPLWGQDKWLGGVASFCGRYIYGVPGQAQSVLRVDCQTGAVDTIGGPFPGPFKWLRGVESEVDGKLYCLPSNSHTVLRIDPGQQAVETLGGPFEGDWKWHGGETGHDGKIYCIPGNAEEVLIIDPLTDTMDTMGGPFKGRQKWYGGIKGVNGKIYGIPHNARHVLMIDPANGVACTIGMDLGDGGWKWHGGLATDGGNIIYGIPCHSDSILRIDTRTDEVSLVGGPIHSGRSDNKYKYLGGGVGAGGVVYFFPCNAHRVLSIDPRTDEAKFVGPDFKDVFYLRASKWQNGFGARDGCVYAVPQNAPGVLRIKPSAGGDAEVSVLPLGRAMDPNMRDKFEGGVMGGDGCIYCIPLRAKHVVRVVPEQLDSATSPSS